MAVGLIFVLKLQSCRNGIDPFLRRILHIWMLTTCWNKHHNPKYALDVNGTVRATNILSTTAKVGDLTFAGNSITDTGIIDLGTADSVVYNDKLTVDGIEINDNTIRTTESNANPEFDANGTGTIEILTDTNIDGNLHVTGNISTDGNITIGDSATDSITFNPKISKLTSPQMQTILII